MSAEAMRVTLTHLLHEPEQESARARLERIRSELDPRTRDAEMLGHIVALGVVGIKMNAVAWGEAESITLEHTEQIARASIALDSLLELREEYLNAMQVFESWEAETMQLRAPNTVRALRAADEWTPALEAWRLDVLAKPSRRRPVDVIGAWELTALMCDAHNDHDGATYAREQARILAISAEARADAKEPTPAEAPAAAPEDVATEEAA